MASLLSAVYSYRLSRQSHHVATYHGVIGLLRELDKTFIEHPEIRPYFYGGKPLAADDPQLPRVQAVAELVLDSFEWIWYKRKSFDAENGGGWKAYMVDTFSSSPALQTHYAKSASWYPGITRLIADCSIALGRDVAGAGGAGVVDRLGRGDPAGDREGRPGEGGGD
ncbi:hypothetical protein [Micromonospora haikouensis]|uniref:hypothetical protein n=1 Tax=Micromonospora haikouensis TaxID=686309 RepID=UPI003D759BEB